MDGRGRGYRGGLLGAVAVLLAALPGRADGQVMRGHLIDAETENPIPAATIMMMRGDSVPVDVAVSDTAGFFSVASEDAGAFRLVARRIGYPATGSDALRLKQGDTLQVEFRISAGVVLLDPVVVTARRRGPPPDIRDFYKRAENPTFGTFMTREEIDAAHAMRVSDLLRRIPGVQLVPVRYGVTGVRMRGCSPAIIIDGVQARFEPSIDNLVVPMELEGLEVYRNAAEIPVQYGGLRLNCGAIMAWTRRGP